MIEISQKDFEAKVQDIIDGKTTRNKLLIELKADRITLNNKIQELSIYNPELYKAFIEKFPYRPREYTHVDYEAIIIDILKNGYKRRELDEVYDGVSSRTIQRKIDIIAKNNPELVELYRLVSKYRKEQKTLPEELQRKIDDLEERKIFLGDPCDFKREELLEKEKQFNEAMKNGMGATKASKRVGQKRVSKAINTLNRINREKGIRNDKEKGEK